MKIRNKLILSFSIAFLFVIVLAIFAIGYYSGDILKDQVFSYLYSNSRARAEHIRTFLQDQKKTSVILAAASVYRDFLNEPVNSRAYPSIKAKIDKRLIRTIEADPTIDEAFILDRHGKIAASSERAREGLDRSQDLYFIQGSKEVYIKDVYLSSTTKKVNYAIASPVTDDSGKLLGVSVLRYNADNFFSIVGNENGMGATEENFLINSQKYLITPTKFLDVSNVLNKVIDTNNANECFDPQEIEYTKKNGYSGLDKESKHGDLFLVKDYRGVEVLAIHRYIPETGWCLITEVDAIEILKANVNLVYAFFIVFLVSLILFLIIISFLATNLTNPIIDLEKGIKKVESGDYNARVGTTRKDELGELSRLFDKMLVSVDSARQEIEEEVQVKTKDLQSKTAKMELVQKAMTNLLKDVNQDKKVIEEERARYSSLLQSIGDGVIATDKDGVVIYGNKVAFDLIKVKEKDAIGKKIVDLVASQNKDSKEIVAADRPISMVIKKKKVSSMIHYYICKDGTRFPVSTTVSPIIIDGQIIGAIEIFRDITHELEVDKAKTEFVSLASHQLRTPLSTVNWYSEMLLAGDAGKINKTQKQYLNEIYNGNKRMVDLVNALLNVSRIELGTFIIDPAPTNIVDVVKITISEIMPMVKAKQIDLVQNYDPAIPVINLDPKMTKILLQNLITNAVKYTPEKGRVEVTIKPEKKDLLIKVADTGYGIPKDSQNKIFQKLYRADNVREKETDGTGLGLYLAKSIVETVGGKIWFQSEENKGTTFYITIPLKGMIKKSGSKLLN